MVSVSASEAACGFSTGVANFPERISSFRGDAGENGASRERMLCAVLLVESGSSGMVSLDSGRAVPAAERDVALSGEVALSVGAVVVAARDEGRVEAVEDVAGRGRVDVVGLAVAPVRDDSVEGRLGAAEAVVLPPKVVRRVVVAVLSVADSGFVVLELRELVVGVLALDRRLFSSLDAPSSVDFVVVLRAREDTGRVGGFVMVVPLARDDKALVRLAEGDVVDLDDGALSRSVTEGLFLASSPGVALPVLVVGVLLGGFLSIFPVHSRSF